MKNKCCIDCGKQIFNFYATRCQSCCKKGVLHFNHGKKLSMITKQKISLSHKGEKSRFYIDGRSLKIIFCKCGKQIDYTSKVCLRCRAINFYQENPNFNKGINNPRYGQGDLIRGKNNPNWKGGKRITTQGYVLVYCPTHPSAQKNGSVQEHRLVMEEKLGRYLKSEEVIHHKNRNRSDNRIINLRLFKNHSEHRKYHEKVNQRYLQFLKVRIIRLSNELKQSHMVQRVI